MDIQFCQITCTNNNFAIKICCNPQCKIPPFICDIQQCNCQQHHNCNSEILKHIIKKLLIKGRSLIPLYHHLQQWYESHIKELTIRLEEVKSIIYKQNPILTGEQRDLYNLFKNNQYTEITSQLVYKALTQLRMEPEYINIQKKKTQIKKKLENHSKKIQQILFNLKEDEKSIIRRIKVQGKFSIDLHHPHMDPTNGYKILKIRDDYMRDWQTSLLEYPVQKFGSCRQVYRFRFSNSNGQISFGLCHLKEAIWLRYSHNYGKGRGGYVIFGNRGLIQTHNGQEIQDKQQIRFYIQNYDLVELIYTPNLSGQSKLQFVNLTLNCKKSCMVKNQPQNPLYPCILLFQKKAEVQLLSVEVEE